MMEQRIFPAMSDIELLRLSLHFYSQAYRSNRNSKKTLVQRINSELGRRFSANRILSLREKINIFYDKTKNAPNNFEELLQMVKIDLKLKSEKESLVVFREIYTYNEVSPDHKVVVILCASLLESLLDLLIRNILLHQKVSHKYINILMKRAKNFDAISNLFYEVSGDKLTKAFDHVGEKTFIKNWDTIRKQRNDFIHKTPFAIDIDTCEISIDAAILAIDVFAKLHNNYAAKYRSI